MASEIESELEARRRDPRYQRLMAATRAAARGGYDAVSMRDLAETARMSLTTVYQFCSSKDHLIAEAHLEVMEDFRRSLAGGKRRGRTAEERVRQVMRGIVNGLERDETLTRTLMRAIYSLDPSVAEVSRGVSRAFTDMVDGAIGDDEIDDRDAVIETLGRVVDSAVYGWLARRDTVASVQSSIDQAVTVLVGRRAASPAQRDPGPARRPRRTGRPVAGRQ